MCTLSIRGCYQWVLAGGEAWVAGFIHLATAAWGVNLIAKALRSFPFSNDQAWGSGLLVMQETQQWGAREVVVTLTQC